MHVSVVMFASRQIDGLEAAGSAVLEVGSCDVNGSIRPLIEDRKPRRYVGVDIGPGPGVDEVCPSEALIEQFGAGSFDVVVSTEMLEHVVDWRAVITNMKGVLRPGGRLLITTRSRGFPYHAWPVDTWRYELDDLKQIFSDFEITGLTPDPDPERPGVFLTARRPVNYQPTDISHVALFSMMQQRRILDTADAMRPTPRFFLRAAQDLLLNATLGGVLRRVTRFLHRMLSRLK